jgi:hypothetical protein
MRSGVEARVVEGGAVQEMEVWPSGVALQGEASNHRKLRRSRAGVVSVAETARRRARQVGPEKANASEPLMTCRKLLDDIKTEAEAVSRDERGGSLLTARAVSGMKVARAQVGVLHGTWEPVALTVRVGQWRQHGPAVGSGTGALRAAELRGAEYRCGAQGRTAPW